MDYTYNYNISQTLNDKVNLTKLETEIRESDIIISLDFITLNDVIISINFKGELSDIDENKLNDIIILHNGEVIDYMIPQKVKIIEEPTPDGMNITQGHYKATSFLLDISGSTGEYVKDISYPYYISIISAQWVNTIDNIGDTASFIISPDTLIGAIVSGATIGQSEFYVQDSVIGALDMGYIISINGENLGQIYKIDKIKKKITTEFKTKNSYNIGSLIRMGISVVDVYYFNGTGVVTIGSSKIGSSIIPPNTIMRIGYNNINGLPKKFSLLIDYSY